MKYEDTERITRELRQKGVLSLVAIKIDEGINVVINGEWEELVPLAVTMVHTLIEKNENPQAARMAFVTCLMDPALRDMINDAKGEVIYDEEGE